MQDVESISVPPVGGVFRWSMPVRWGDLDALNHVNNAVYFRYLEEARVQLFAQAGTALPPNRITLLAHVSCDFLRPVLYPATVVVSQVLTRVGRSSLSMDTLIECEGEPGVAYAKGRQVMVGGAAETGKSMPWTPQELERLSALFTRQ